MNRSEFLPATRKEMEDRGWDYVDVVLVTGDAYVDHPTFGVALIGRWLEAHGFRVAVLAQPRHDSPDDFTTFGRPKLFFGVTAGNLDSIVANYTSNAKVRDVDDFSPGGDPYFNHERIKSARRRPDRATIFYTNLARAAFHDVPVILGGLEASLRRFAHYDYQQEKIRASILTDAKADLLVYGMGERAVLDIAGRLRAGLPLRNIASTCERLTDRELARTELPEPVISLPSLAEIQQDGTTFMKAELAIDKNARAAVPALLLQKQQAHWVLQNKPAVPLHSEELDRLYELPFRRAPHPQAGNVPAYTMIRHSITIVRGCFGNCSFCSITRHQGPQVTSRSQASIVREAKLLADQDDFRGTISDLGGPTANMFAVTCGKAECNRHDCLYPQPCRSLRIDESAFLRLLDAIETIPKVKHVYVSSGLRMELLLQTPALLARLIAGHVPGAMKIAPEHTEEKILRLMHKQKPEMLRTFVDYCRALAAKQKKNIFFTPYIIASHPGCTVEDMRRLAGSLKELGLQVRQLQDFTPTPGTLSTAMYVSGLDRDTGLPIHIAKSSGERRAQRQLLEKKGRHHFT
jgi:uncharacterized radical SAM protein YgiQ